VGNTERKIELQKNLEKKKKISWRGVKILNIGID
jgi:hypothetical protein